MAVERQQAFTIDLGEIVKTRLDSFVNTRNKILAKKEADFQSRVSSEGMSLETQLLYRQSQLEEEGTKTFPYQDWISELNKEIANLKKLGRYEKIRNQYLEDYTIYKEGKSSVDSLINGWESQLARETDPTMRTEILNNLSTLKIEKVNNDMQALTNRVTLAKLDKSVDLLDQVISEVTNKRNDALLIGDSETITNYDVQLQSLKSTKQELVTETKLHDFDLKVTKDGIGASAKLGLLENAISGANATDVVWIDNTRYNSEAEYWTQQRNSYLAGSGTGVFKNFFSDFKSEVDSKITNLSAMNKYGYVPLSSIEAINKDFQTLASNPVYQPYLSQIENARISTLSDAVDKTAKAIIAESVMNLDFDSGEQALKNLGAKFGIDTAVYLGDLFYKKLNTATTVEAMQKTAEAMAEIKGTTPEEEMKKMTETVIPPEGKIFEETVQVPELEKKKAGIEGQIAETQKKIEEAQKAKATTPTPSPAPVITPTTTPTTTPKPTGYTGVSIVDYLKSIGQPSDFTSRQKLAVQQGVVKTEAEFTLAKSAELNTQLLKKLRGF